MLLKVRLSNAREYGSFTNVAGIVQRDSPRVMGLANTDLLTGVATFVLSDASLSDAMTSYLNTSNLVEDFKVEQDAPTSEAQPETATVLYEDETRRVVLLASTYERYSSGVTDTVLEMDETGYRKDIVHRSDYGVMRIPLDAATAKKIALELERWEQVHGDAHPF